MNRPPDRGFEALLANRLEPLHIAASLPVSSQSLSPAGIHHQLRI
jgi:hypothetical protein